jgi:hypothetical protein
MDTALVQHCSPGAGQVVAGVMLSRGGGTEVYPVYFQQKIPEGKSCWSFLLASQL